MADETPTETTTDAPVVAEPAAVEAVEAEKPKASDGLAKDLAAERRKVKALQDQLDAAAREKMSDQEKMAADLAAAQAELGKYRSGALQTEAAAKAGLPASMASRLRGESLEEMVADATALKKELGLVTPAAGGKDAGARSDAKPAAPSMNDLLRAVARGQ